MQQCFCCSLACVPRRRRSARAPACSTSPLPSALREGRYWSLAWNERDLPRAPALSSPPPPAPGAPPGASEHRCLCPRAALRGIGHCRYGYRADTPRFVTHLPSVVAGRAALRRRPFLRSRCVSL